MATAHDEDIIEGEVITRESSDTVIGTIAKAETDMQISTAKTYPRSVRRFMDQVRELVTLNEDIAGECMYALPRGGKTIEGPSARFAEVVLSCWGNSHGAAQVVGEDDRFVTAQAVVWDLERNVRIAFSVRRRITNKYNKKYDDDMIGVTGNAAASIAFRNAVLKVVPKAFWNQLYLEARRTAIGDAKTLSSRRAALVQAFGKMGVTEQMILSLLEVNGIEDVTLDHLATLRGVYTAIKDEGQSIESIFSSVPAAGSKVSRSDVSAPKAGIEELPRQASQDNGINQVAEILSDRINAAETEMEAGVIRSDIKKAAKAKSITADEAASLERSLQGRLESLNADYQ